MTQFLPFKWIVRLGGLWVIGGCHIVQEADNNDFVSYTYRHSSEVTWANAIQWLHHNPPSPIHISQNLWSSLHSKAKNEYSAALNQIHPWILGSSDGHPDACTPPLEHRLHPF
jgi:hypothetical protein